MRKLFAAGYVMPFTEQKPLNTNVKKMCLSSTRLTNTGGEQVLTPLFLYNQSGLTADKDVV